MMFKFIVFFGVAVALAAVLWWYYPTVRGLPDASPLEAKCKAVRERADIQEGLSMLHDIDNSLAKVNVEYARVKKLNAGTPKDLGGLARGVEERQRDLSNKKTQLLGGVPCLADLYNAEQH
jgi:hypothetical protein